MPSFTSVVRSAWNGILIFAVAASPLVAQDHPVPRCRDTAPRDTSLASYRILAARYAPELRFAPQERIFPTAPFFSAFDGIDNYRANPATDLMDPNEVAVLEQGDASLDSLFRMYQEEVDRQALEVKRIIPPFVVVFYRVRPLGLNSRNAMWHFLRSDEQAWHRFEMDRLWPEADRDTTEFLVIEYYFYYLRDAGLKGHAHDIESVFVFIPRVPQRACEFRLIVGAGHSGRTPNNILVQIDRDVWDVRGTFVLVELGGHSSAPDVAPYGEFQIGVDANWQVGDIWGTRDLQAVAGLGFYGQYQPEMTFDRSRGVVVKKRKRLGTSGYYLLPVAPFEQLSEVLAVRPTDHSAIRKRLDSLRVAFQQAGYKPPATLHPDTIAALPTVTFDRMTTWVKGTRSDGKEYKATKHQIWNHALYQGPPSAIFKAYLYRPEWNTTARSISGLLSLVTWGLSVVPSDGAEAYVGWIVPGGFLGVDKIPLRIQGFLEVQVGAFASTDLSRWSPSFGIVHNNSYQQQATWYLRFGVIPRRAEVLGDSLASDFILSGGLSLLPVLQPKSSWWDPINALRVHIGPRLDLFKDPSPLSRVRWEIRVSFRQ